MSKILSAASAGNFDELSDLWLESLSAGVSTGEMIQVLQILHDRNQENLAIELLDLAIEEMSSKGSEDLNCLLKGVAGVIGHSEILRKALVEAVRDEFLMFKPLERYLKLSGLISEGVVVRSAWQRFNDLMKYSDSRFIYHRIFGPGRIEKANRTSLSINFQRDAHHDMNLDVVLESTVPLGDGSLIVMRWLDPDGFIRLYEEDLPMFLKKLVKEPFGTSGEISQDDLTPIFEGLDISITEAWKSLRSVAATSAGFADLGDRILAQEVNSGTAAQIRTIIRGSKSSISLKTREIQALVSSSAQMDKDSAKELLAEVININSPETGALYELCWILSDKGNQEEFLAAAYPFVENTSARCGRAVGEIHSLSCRKKYLEMFLSGASPEKEKLHLLLQLKRPLWEYSTSLLIHIDPKLLQQNLHIFMSDETMVDRFLWALCFLAENESVHRPEIVGQGFAGLLIKNLPFASADTQKRVAGVLKGSISDEFSSYLSSVDTRRLTDHLNSLDNSSTAHREGIYLAVGREISRRKVSDGFKPQTRFFWESDSLYSSREAIERRRKDCLHLKRVEIPAAAEAVGIAASHGDLSENAEYSAALERRDLLLDKLRRWTDEMELYLPYPGSEISSNLIAPGTGVELVCEDDGESRILEVVGPLDTDPNRSRINYLAPVARSLLGKAPGERIFLPGDSEREWEIVSVNVLEELVTS